MLTQSELKEWLHYDKETGIFTWIKKPCLSVNIGDIAGHLHKKLQYIQIQIRNKNYLAHRLAWLYVYGVWPLGDLDHRDTIRYHNWVSNLREAVGSQNNYNTGITKRNSSGFVGVSWHKGANKYIATIRYNKKLRHLGYFNTAEEAGARRLLFAEKIHGEFLHESLKNR